MPPKKRKIQSKHASAKGGSAFKRLCRSKAAMKKYKQRERNRWIDMRDTFKSLLPTVENRKGRVRTYDENRMILLALFASLKRHVNSLIKGNIKDIKWIMIETEVSEDFHVRKNYVVEIRKTFLDCGSVIVIDPQIRGQGAVSSKFSKNRKVTNEMLHSITNLVDSMHSEGKGVVARHIIAHLLEKYQTLVHRTTVGRWFDKLGLTWAPMKEVDRTFAKCRKVIMRKYLVQLDKYVKGHNNGNDSFIFVLTDESYFNKNHGNN